MSNLITTPEAAALLGLNDRTLVKWRLRGEGPPHVRLGASVRYCPAALEKYIGTNTVRP